MDELRLYLSPPLWERMRAHVNREAPEEACGLVAGTGNRAAQVFPITNQLHSPTRYRMEPKEQLAAFNEMDAEGWELLAIYHSHPYGPARPSVTDVDEAYYPDSFYLIWSRRNDAWDCLGFLIQDEKIRQIEVVLSPSE